MPKKLTINEIKSRFEKYGFIILDDKYKNNKQKLKVYDAQLNKNVNLSVQDMKYQIDRKKRSEFDFNNILPIEYQPELQQRERFNVFDVLPVNLQPTQQRKQPIFDMFGILPVNLQPEHQQHKLLSVDF